MSPSPEPGTDRLFKGLGFRGLGFRDGETRGLEHASPSCSRHKVSRIPAQIILSPCAVRRLESRISVCAVLAFWIGQQASSIVQKIAMEWDTC